MENIDFDLSKYVIKQTCIKCGKEDTGLVNGKLCIECFNKEKKENSQENEIWQEKVNKHGFIIDDEREEMTLLKDRLLQLHDELFNDEKYHASGWLIVDINKLDKRLNPENY